MLLFYLQTLDTPEELSKFELIYNEYKSLMYIVAHNILEHVADSEDAVHQAFMTIADNLDKIDDPLSNMTKSYVLTITSNKAIDISRSNNRHTIIPYDETYIDVPTMTKALEECAEDTLSKCILRLPAKYRTIIMLKYHHGYTLQEISEILNMSLTNAIKIDQRAKKRLQKMCEEEGRI